MEPSDETSPPTPLQAGALTAALDVASLRDVRFHGVETIRRIDFPIRDADWRTLPFVPRGRTVDAGEAPRAAIEVATADGAVEARFEVEATATPGGARLEARLRLLARRAVEVNRAGFVLLHPIAGVAGTALRVRRPDGRTETSAFPSRISPGQPVFEIAGLAHGVHGVSVDIAFDGEVFEMEDQRNWTDASFKTYCRPLAWPRPYRLEAGAEVTQAIVVTLSGGTAPEAAQEPAPDRAVGPAIVLAHDAALAEPPTVALDGLGVAGVLVRLDAATAAEARAPATQAPVTLEIVYDADPAAAVSAARAAAPGAARIIALSRAYLASHQPEGPWPAEDAYGAVAALRDAFPDAEVGGGMLTNFTELNRRPPPDPTALDFLTFGTTAIVHAADDASVLQTLEALGDVFDSAHALAAGRPLRLGLVSIGMRSNPYGAAVAPNPDGLRLAMAMDDPRQRLPFAAAWAVGAAAAAARGGVASFAPAMTAGPLGLGRDGSLWPIFHAVAGLAALGGVEVAVSGGPATGRVALIGRGRRGVAGVIANLGPDPVALDAPKGTAALLIGEPVSADPDWIDGPGGPAPATLAPFEVAVLKAAGA